MGYALCDSSHSNYWLIMAVNVFTGLPGSGKSYECVSTVIVDAVIAGRRVVTNVDGIDNDEVRIYAHEKSAKPFDELGNVIHCKNDDVQKPDFLPHGKNVDTFCRLGDLVCIDEAWRFWGADCKILPEHYIFFREHRHYVDEVTKVSCDMALMVQDITDLHRKIKVVVEMTLRTTKIKSLGMSKTYRVEIWEGYKTLQRSKVRTEVKRYDSRIFPLYSSYEGGSGKELVMDDRQNLLKSPKLWLFIIGLLIALVIAGYQLKKFFFGNSARPPISSMALPSTGAVTPAVASSSKSTNFSTDYRAVGYFSAGGTSWVTLQDASNRLRFESPSMFTEPRSIYVVGSIDGQKVTSFSGVPFGAAAQKGEKK